jgi:hypothetical protein
MNGFFIERRPDVHCIPVFFYVRISMPSSEHNRWITVDKLWINMEKKEMNSFLRIKFCTDAKNFNSTSLLFLICCNISNYIKKVLSPYFLVL